MVMANRLLHVVLEELDTIVQVEVLEVQIIYLRIFCLPAAVVLEFGKVVV